MIKELKECELQLVIFFFFAVAVMLFFFLHYILQYFFEYACSHVIMHSHMFNLITMEFFLKEKIS